MRNLSKFLGIIALAAVIVFGMAACDDGSDKGDEPGLRVPSVTALPEFSSGSTPATSKQAAELVLAEMRETLALYELRDEINEFVWEYIEERFGDDDWSKYSFDNQPIPGANIKVSASDSESESVTGGYKKLDELRNKFEKDYGEDWNNEQDTYEKYVAERDKIQFAAKDREKYTYQGRRKGEVTADKLIDTVTIVKGSTLERFWNDSEEETVTKACTYKTLDENYSGSGSGKEQTVIGCTVTTSIGSIKIVLGLTEEWSYSYKSGEETEKEKYSGSLKIYGANNEVLINHPINSWRDYDKAAVMIGYDYDDDYDLDEYSISALSVRKARTIGPKR